MIEGLQLPYGIKPTNPVPVDTLSGPYVANSLQDAINLANSSIPIELRYLSLQVRLIVNGQSFIFWYRNGITDSDLVNIGIGNFIPRKVEFVIGNGEDTEFVLDHNLGTTFVIVQIFESSTGSQIEADVVRIDGNNVKLAFSRPPETLEYSVVII